MLIFSILTAECWSGAKDTGNEAKSTYDKHGEANSMCINSQYKDFYGNKDSCEAYAGKQSANFVYKVTSYTGLDTNRFLFYFAIILKFVLLR